MVALLSSASTTVMQTALWVKKIHAHLGILEGVQENGEEAPLPRAQFMTASIAQTVQDVGS